MAARTYTTWFAYVLNSTTQTTSFRPVIGALGINMKYRSLCPSCNANIPNSWYFHVLPHIRKKCPVCRSAIKVDSKWEWIGNCILGIPIGIGLLLGAGGVVHWAISLIIISLTVLVGYVLFPYMTPFNLVEAYEENS